MVVMESFTMCVRYLQESLMLHKRTSHAETWTCNFWNIIEGHDIPDVVQTERCVCKNVV